MRGKVSRIIWLGLFFLLLLFCFLFLTIPRVLLTDPFPIDPIQENYVRNVRNCIFSIVYPTPFKSRVLLVAVSEVGIILVPLQFTAVVKIHIKVYFNIHKLFIVKVSSNK